MSGTFLHRSTVFLVLVVFTASAAAPKPAPVNCWKYYAGLLRRELVKHSDTIQFAAKPTGFLLGAANDIVITALGGAGFLPHGIRALLPLTNEIASVAATSTGKRWLYHGISKSLADNVSLASILGGALSSGLAHGPISGGISLAAGVGIAYWLPLTFLHPFMVGVPKAIPERFKKTKAFAESGPGKAVLGISFIGTLEVLLWQSHKLVEMASWHPDHDEEKKDPKEISEEEAKQAAAIFLLDGFLFDKSDLTGEERDKALIYLSGTTRDGGTFSASARTSLPKPDVTLEPSKFAALHKYLEKQVIKDLLTAEQRSDIKQRAASLVR